MELFYMYPAVLYKSPREENLQKYSKVAVYYPRIKKVDYGYIKNTTAIYTKDFVKNYKWPLDWKICTIIKESPLGQNIVGER